MKSLKIEVPYTLLNESELNEADRLLVEEAKKACQRSYAPYSKFHVGAAVLLENGEVLAGNNQENAAYPAGICAERCALFYANAKFPQTPVRVIAIAAQKEDGTFTEYPITPCGVCRQVLLETEQRFGAPMRVLLYGSQCVYELSSCTHLLPLRFDSSCL